MPNPKLTRDISHVSFLELSQEESKLVTPFIWLVHDNFRQILDEKMNNCSKNESTDGDLNLFYLLEDFCTYEYFYTDLTLYKIITVFLPVFYNRLNPNYIIVQTLFSREDFNNYDTALLHIKILLEDKNK